MKQFLFSISLCIVFQNAHSQEMLGIINSNYAGSAGLSINPASVVGMPFRREINIYTQQMSLQNNYLYMPKGSSITDLFKGQSPMHDAAAMSKNATADKQLALNMFTQGPSYLSSYKNFGWAVHTAMRMDVNATGLNSNFANLVADGINSVSEKEMEIEYKIDPFSVNLLQWYEVGATVGGTLLQSRRHMITAGATLKMELGSNAAQINCEQMSFHVSPADTLKVYNLTGTYSHTITTNNPGFNDIMGVKGIGGGLTLGAQYYLLREENVVDAVAKNNRRYIFRIGASLMDIGKLHYTKDTRVNEFNNSSATWSSLSKLKFEGINEFDESLAEVFTGTTNGALKKETMDIALPTAASLQLDINFYRNFYVNTTWVQSVTLADQQVKRASQLSVTARYQSAKFEVSIPYSFYQYYKNRVGICIRYKCFFIGTDQVGSYTGKFKTDGIDTYFGVRVYM